MGGLRALAPRIVSCSDPAVTCIEPIASLRLTAASPPAAPPTCAPRSCLDPASIDVYGSRSMPGGWNLITQNLYDSLLAAFRDNPGRYASAARAACCAPATAKRAWLKGWPSKNHKPIQLALEEEKRAAAAAARDAVRRQAEEAQAIRDKARLENIETLAQERQMLKAARGDVLACLVMAAELVPAMRNAGRVISKACEPGPDGSPPAISPALAMQLLTRHAQLIQRAVGSAEAVIQLSRLDRGAATAHVAITGAEDMSLEAALDELETLESSLRAARPALVAPDPDDD